MKLNLLQLFYFYKTYVHQGMTPAVKELGITKSNLSIALTKLERSFGCQLYFMRKRQMVFTERGQELFTLCESMFGAKSPYQEIVIWSKTMESDL